MFRIATYMIEEDIWSQITLTKMRWTTAWGGDFNPFACGTSQILKRVKSTHLARKEMVWTGWKLPNEFF